MTWIEDALNVGKKEKEEEIKREQIISQAKAVEEEKREAASKYAEDYTQQVFDQHFGQIMRELSDHGYQVTKKLSKIILDRGDARKKIGRFFKNGFRFVRGFDYDSNGPNTHAEAQTYYTMGGSSLEITIDGLFLNITFTPILSNPNNANASKLLGFVMQWDKDFYLVDLNTSVENIKVALKNFLAEKIRAQANR